MQNFDLELSTSKGVLQDKYKKCGSIELHRLLFNVECLQ